MGNLRLGDIIVFKGRGFLFRTLGTMLKLFEPEWDFWGWHIGFICKIDDEIHIAEALAYGVCVHVLDREREFRIYRWLDVEPEQWRVMYFVNQHKGDKYDPLAYVWTFMQRAVYKLFNWQLPRLQNDRFTCWEWTELFCTVFGKCWTMTSPLLFPLITDFLNQHPTMVMNLSQHQRL